jgi:hypothetical protein
MNFTDPLKIQYFQGVFLWGSIKALLDFQPKNVEKG